MAVYYKLYQDNRKESDTKGMWYGRAKMTETIETEAIAERIQRNCSMKRSDVLAVITELVEVMQDELQASHRVKLNGFGAFKIGIHSKGASSVKAYSVSKHVKGLRVVFQPEVNKSADGTRTKTFLTGTEVKEFDSQRSAAASTAGAGE